MPAGEFDFVFMILGRCRGRLRCDVHSILREYCILGSLDAAGGLLLASPPRSWDRESHPVTNFRHCFFLALVGFPRSHW